MGRVIMLDGHRFQQNGYQGARPKSNWILPTPLPFNHLVDRGLCSEIQLLSGVCEELMDSVYGSSFCQLQDVQGWLWLFVTGAPCLSCVGAMQQFQLLLPGTQLRVTIGEELQFDALG